MNLTHQYLGVTERERIVDLWKTYKQFTVRPVLSTEKYYRDIIEQHEKQVTQAFVYGGTPEIRSALQRSKIETILVDRSKVMVEAMGLLTISGIPLALNESFKEGDWLDLPIDDNSVQFALGDDAINMLDWDQFPAFLSETNRILVPGGWFACHLLVQPPEDYRRQSVSEVVKLYRKGDITSVFDFASRVNFIFYDNKTYKMGWQTSIIELRKALKEGLILDDYSFIERFKNCYSSFACPPLELWDVLVRKYFQVYEIFYPKEFDYCRFEPLYLLRKPL